MGWDVCARCPACPPVIDPARQEPRPPPMMCSESGEEIEDEDDDEDEESMVLDPNIAGRAAAPTV